MDDTTSDFFNEGCKSTRLSKKYPKNYDKSRKTIYLITDIKNRSSLGCDLCHIVSYT